MSEHEYQYKLGEKKELSYFEDYHKTKFSRFLEDKIYHLRSVYAKYAYFKEFYEEEKKVLDFGCGFGFNTAWIKNKYGYDLNKTLYPFLESKHFILFDNFSDIPDNYFDEIILTAVLEHLHNPMEVMKELRKKLKPKGIVRIMLPFIGFQGEKDINASDDGHVYGWGFYEINYFLNVCGYKNLVNKKIYRKGIGKFSKVFKNYPRLYCFAVKTLGRLMNDFDILIISQRYDDE